MSVCFATVASGSAGNCVLVGTEQTKILIDAGLSGKKIENGLSELNLTGQDIDAIFITHEHIDHTDGVGVMSRRYDLPIYATEGSWQNMPSKVGEIRERNKNAVYCGETTIINDICISPFEIPHDAAEPVGYNIFVENKKLTVATDIGHVTETVFQSVRGSDFLLIESNHDVDMLKRGSYPYELKQRILSDLGHLSNNVCAALLAKVAESGLKRIALGHLSFDNNDAILAFEVARAALEKQGAMPGQDIILSVAQRYGLTMI